MIHYLDSFEEFDRIKKIGQSLIETNKTIPEMVFKTDFDSHYFTDYSTLFNSKGPQWDHILKLAGKSNTGQLVILILNPDPESYYSWCKRYGTILVDPIANKGDIIEILSESPKENTEDAMYVIVDRFVVFSEYSQDWCLWADRYYEIAVLAVNDCFVQQINKETLSYGWLNTEQAINELFKLSFFPKPIPDDFCLELLKNYGGL